MRNLKLAHVTPHVRSKFLEMKRGATTLLVRNPKYTKKQRFIGPVRNNYASAPRRSNQSSALKPELKYFDTAFTTDATSTSTVVQLNSVAAGDTALTRDGNKLAMRSLELRIKGNLEATTQNASIRFVLLIDKQPNNATISWGTVFDSESPQSLRLIASMSRFEILMDKVIIVNATSTTALQKFFFKKYVKMPNIVSSYTDGSAAIPYTNSLILMYNSDVATGITDTDIFGQARLRFVG